MQEIINEKVSVIMTYNQRNGLVKPEKIKWQGRIHTIETIGYHHKFHEGKKLIHIFSVADRCLAFRLRFDSDTLHWTLEEISDGTAN